MWDGARSAKSDAPEPVMLSQVLSTIRSEQLLAAGERVLVAVSGGPDSTALLHALARLRARLGCEIQAAVVDHGLRPEAAAEARAVTEACRRLQLHCGVLVVDVSGGRRRGESLQTAARRLRLAALQEAAAAAGCQRVALGHTADDQAETVLFRIVRGTGLRGLSGIPYRRGPFVRPLLDVRRAQVLGFLRRHGVGFVEDPSNRDRRFARTRVRHEWLPFLAAENPRVVEALLSLARQARTGGPRPGWRSDPRLAGRAADVIERLAARAAGTRRVSFRAGFAEIRYGEVILHDRSDAQPQDGGSAPDPVSVRCRGPTVAAGAATVEVRLVILAAPHPTAWRPSMPAGWTGGWFCARYGRATACAREAGRQPQAAGPDGRCQDPP
jgi:tRNA(Ile)-lysidine synthetase-like protein